MRADQPEVDLLLFDEAVSVFNAFTYPDSFPRVDILIRWLCTEQDL